MQITPREKSSPENPFERIVIIGIKTYCNNALLFAQQALGVHPQVSLHPEFEYSGNDEPASLLVNRFLCGKLTRFIVLGMPTQIFDQSEARPRKVA